MLRRRTLVKEKVEAVIPESDIVLYDSQLNKEIVICNLDYNLTDYPKDRFTPIGVVVIPQDHAKVIYPEGHYCYNKPVMMSLNYMRYNTPDTGGKAQGIKWGYDNKDLLLRNYQKSAVVANSEAEETSTESSDTSSYIPSTKFTAWESKAAPKTFYYRKDAISYPPCPSPFLYKDGIWGPNSAYYNCPATCIQHDRDGKGNTAIILESVTVPDWKTASSINNNRGQGNYPAACCCWRYHTVADNQGDWYLPAGGELGYIIPFLIQHNNAIDHINNIYGNKYFTIIITEDYTHWTSSNGGTYMACSILTSNGYIDINDRKEYANYVRAFRPVKI